MTPILVESSARPDTTHLGEPEQDLWWGSYAGRAMTPSFIVCAILTVLIFLGARWWVPQRGWLQLTFTGFAGALWLVQLVRWGHRFFTWNYRLTTRHLYVDRGMKPLIASRYNVSTISRVDVHQNRLDKWLGIGDLLVFFEDETELPAVLKALAAPRNAASLIREAVKKVRETPTPRV